MFSGCTALSAIFELSTASAASSSVSMPPSATSRVRGSAFDPAPFSVNDPPAVAFVTSLPMTPSVSVMTSAESSTRTQSVPFHCRSCPAAVPSAMFSVLTASSASFELSTASAASSSVSIPPSETSSVSGSALVPEPLSVKDPPAVALVTSLPMIPSVSVMASAESSTSTQSVPFHCRSCPAAVPSAMFSGCTASSAILALVIPSLVTEMELATSVAPVPVATVMDPSVAVRSCPVMELASITPHSTSVPAALVLRTWSAVPASILSTVTLSSNIFAVDTALSAISSVCTSPSNIFAEVMPLSATSMAISLKSAFIGCPMMAIAPDELSVPVPVTWERSTFKDPFNAWISPTPATLSLNLLAVIEAS